MYYDSPFDYLHKDSLWCLLWQRGSSDIKNYLQNSQIFPSLSIVQNIVRWPSLCAAAHGLLAKLTFFEQSFVRNGNATNFRVNWSQLIQRDVVDFIFLHSPPQQNTQESIQALNAWTFIEPMKNNKKFNEFKTIFNRRVIWINDASTGRSPWRENASSS